MRFSKKRYILGTLMVAVLFMSSVLVSPAAFAAEGEIMPRMAGFGRSCSLSMDDAHERTGKVDGKDREEKAVGVKSHIKCSNKVTKIELTLELRRQSFWFIWNTQHKEVRVLSNVKGNRHIKNFEWKCDNKNKTNWRGRTTMKVWDTGGRIYTIKKESPHEASYKCG